MKVIEEKELLLEPLRVQHADDLYQALRDDRIYDYISEGPPEKLQDLRRRYAFLESRKSIDGKEDWLNWVVYERQLNRPVGTVQASVRPGDSADIAFVIFPEYWNNAYGRHATNAMVDFLFSNYGLKTVVAKIDTRNQRSIRMTEALGFERVNLLLNADYINGQYCDEYVYEVTSEGWHARATK